MSIVIELVTYCQFELEVRESLCQIKDLFDYLDSDYLSALYSSYFAHPSPTFVTLFFKKRTLLMKQDVLQKLWGPVFLYFHDRSTSRGGNATGRCFTCTGSPEPARSWASEL